MSVSRASIAVAIEALSWIDYEGLSERAAFSRATRQLHISQKDQLRAAHSLILETERRRNFIDFLIRQAIQDRFDFASLQHGVRSLLRLFCYSAKFQQRGAEEHLRILEEGRSVLGWRVLRPFECIFGRILSSSPAEISLSPDDALALQLFHPRWFLSACTLMLGRDPTLQLIRGNMRQPPTYIRINTLHGSEEEWLRKLEKSGIRIEPVQEVAQAYRVLSKQSIVGTQSYTQGGIAVQDKASMLAGLVADPAPGDQVLDVCAAPGGKTAHLAQLMENRGTIYSIDKSPSRLSFWNDEMSRLGVEIAHPIVADAAESIPVVTESDVVIVDPPCSNTGTFWKSPVTKWTIDPQQIERAAKIQLAILENASRLVRPGGSLVYSTCTIMTTENEYVIQRFLRLNPDFQLVEADPRLGIPGLHGLEASQRFYPHIHDSNGQFICKMMRIE